MTVSPWAKANPCFGLLAENEGKNRRLRWCGNCKHMHPGATDIKRGHCDDQGERDRGVQGVH
jgi:hypothetical protein